jgi:hypothetical protein
VALVGKSHLQKCQSSLVCGKLHAGIGVGGFGMGDLLLLLVPWCVQRAVGVCKALLTMRLPLMSSFASCN